MFLRKDQFLASARICSTHILVTMLTELHRIGCLMQYREIIVFVFRSTQNT
jgi:hypothetical protein